MDMRLLALAALAPELVGADVDQLLRRAVIGPVEHDGVFAARMRPHHPERQAVGFRATVDEAGDRQFLRQRRRQALGIGDDIVVQVAGIGVERRRLLRHRLHDGRMGVADVADIVEAVEIGAAAVVDQPDAFAAHELDRLVVGDREVRQQQFAAQLARCLRASGPAVRKIRSAMPA